MNTVNDLGINEVPNEITKDFIEVLVKAVEAHIRNVFFDINQGLSQLEYYSAGAPPIGQMENGQLALAFVNPNYRIYTKIAGALYYVNLTAA